jgi:hypothetical protein
MATVEVWLSDLEPVAGFIAKACRAEAWTRLVTREQAAELPRPVAAAILLLQGAVADLNGAKLPSMAAVLAEAKAAAGTAVVDKRALL